MTKKYRARPEMQSLARHFFQLPIILLAIARFEPLDKYTGNSDIIYP